LALTDSEFKELEALAKIDLGPEERDRLRIQLERILGFVRKLQEVESEEAGAVPAGGARPSADEPGECVDREEVLGQAPGREEAFFSVPPVIERGEE
jgi:aspartyl-tRNA(Asn)/glutamyl-tRNA(Gln) amidotransferase subunit C